MIKQFDDLKEALSDYNALAALPSSGDIARSMENAHNTLLRLANGDLTSAEAWAILEDFGKRMKDISDNLKTVNDKGQAFADKIKEIQ